MCTMSFKMTCRGDPKYGKKPTRPFKKCRLEIGKIVQDVTNKNVQNILLNQEVQAYHPKVCARSDHKQS